MQIHILKTYNGTVDVVFHVPVPEGNNSVGVPWCEAVKHSKLFPRTSEAYDADQQGIKKGCIAEVKETYNYSAPDLTTQEKRAELEARYSEVEQAALDKINLLLKFYGYEEDVS